MPCSLNTPCATKAFPRSATLLRVDSQYLTHSQRLLQVFAVGSAPEAHGVLSERGTPGGKRRRFQHDIG